MKLKKINRLFAGVAMIGGLMAMSGCEGGLTYSEVPESVYSEVGVSSFNIKARELFEDKIYAVNWEKWVPDYINTVVIGGSGKISWTNETSSNYTLDDGTVVAPGGTVELSGTITEEDNANAPGGKLYVMKTYALSRATYSTPNKGYLFDASKFSGDFELVGPTNNRSEKVILPIRKNELIGEFSFVDTYACEVEPQNNAPVLGVPGDFTEPRQYMVVNTTRRPAGVEQARRLYEVRITFLP